MSTLQGIRLAFILGAVPALLAGSAGRATADIITFSDQSAFVNATMPVGPLDPQFSGVPHSITVGPGLVTVTPGPGVPDIGIANIIGIGLPSSLSVDGMSFSDFNFTFRVPATAFGFVVANATAPEFLPGTSLFEVTLFHNATEGGVVRFLSPGSGNIFFGVQSSEPFDFLTLREIEGGPQNATPFGGFADREFFGSFYVTPVPEPSAFTLIGLGTVGLIGCGWRCRKRAACLTMVNRMSP